ncbi:hypothetical protein Bca101_026166 [Brassica carinata]
MLGNLDAFLKYPWGRESFLLTVKSTKSRSAANYVKDTMAIQGFTHAMVLVTVTACPSIIIKTGVADPLADSTLSSEDIVRRVVERKLVVNIVSAKTVDELGQAYVRSLISSDEEGDDLYRGLGDKEDTSVDTLVALIDDDFPFEHNTWSGGVKADEIRVKKGNAQTSESSDENVPEPVEKDKVHHGGVEWWLPWRSEADAYEEKVIAMFEGYILSLKGHFNSEVGGLRTELQSATSAIGQLESKVTGEFEKINQLLKSRFGVDDMGPTYGFSPQSQFPGQDDDFNNAEVNPDRPTTYTGATDGVGAHTEADSPQRDVEDVAATGTASVGLDANLDEGERGGGLSPGKQTDSTDGVKFTSETGGEDKGADHSGHDPVNVEPSSSVNIASPSNVDAPVSVSMQGTSACSGKEQEGAANPPSRVDVDPVNVSSECPIDDPVSGLVNKILSDAGVDKGRCVPQTSSDAIPEKVGIDGKKGDDVDEDDVTITKVQAGRVNTDAAVVQADGGRRFSTRTHTSPKRYTPPAPIVRKKEGNRKVPRRMDDNVPPLASARETFLKKMAEAKSNAPSLGSVISIASLDDMFNCTGVCSYEAVDRVVDKDAFTFPMSLRSQFMHRPRWFTQVDFLYTLVLVKDRHWIGMIVDLPMWAIYVVDANQTCPTTSVIKDVLKPISIMMPHMISRFCLTSRPRELNFLPFPISRLDIPVLLEHPGYSAVVALILLEISTVGKPMIDLSLTEEEVRVAAENYAISMLAMF